MEHPVDKAHIRDHKKFRRSIDTIQKYINACMNMGSYYADKPDGIPGRLTSKDFQLKFVISKESDIDEIRKDFLDHLTFVEPEDIILMPVGGSRNLLNHTSLMTAKLAILNGWRYTPRLHIDIWDDKSGV